MATDRDSARQHANWLSLIEASGPFLSMPVLLECFPQGLDQKENESQVRSRLRLAYEEWADNQVGNRPDPAIHTQWLRFVLDEVLEMRPDTILEGQQIPPALRYEARDHGETLRPHLVIRSPFEPNARLLIQQYPREQKLEKVVPDLHWKASPATRMMELLRASDVRLGLVTNGEHWMLVVWFTNFGRGVSTLDRKQGNRESKQSKHSGVMRAQNAERRWRGPGGESNERAEKANVRGEKVAW